MMCHEITSPDIIIAFIGMGVAVYIAAIVMSIISRRKYVKQLHKQRAGVGDGNPVAMPSPDTIA